MHTVAVNQTEAMLIEQLTTNTGRHFLDSGCAYGRNWERNQGRDFRNEPEAVLKFDVWGNGQWSIQPTYSTFLFLRDRLTYAEELDRNFVAFARQEHLDDVPWLTVIEEWIEARGFEDSHYPGGNTYNDDGCLLDQVLQYETFEHENVDYIALQVHGGCDLRGGYTRPYIYECAFDSSPGFYDYSRVRISCTYEHPEGQAVIPGIEPMEAHYWDMEGGGNYQAETNTGREFGEYAATEDPEERGQGKIYIDEHGTGFCPHCGAELICYW